MTGLKYLSLAGATLAGLAGYFFALKRELPGGGVAPTYIGWAVIAALVFSALATATLTWLDARREQRRTSEAEVERDETRGKLERVQAASEASENAAREAANASREQSEVISVLAAKIEAVGATVASTSSGRDALLSLVRSPALQHYKSRNRELSQALDGLSARLGGRDETLDWLRQHATGSFSPDAITQVATFSLKWFGSDTPARTRRAVIEAIHGLEADVLVLQELLGKQGLRELLAELPDHDGRIARGGGPLSLGLIYRRDRIALVGEADQIKGEGFEGRFDRPPLVQRLRIGRFETDLVCVHFKSRGGPSSRDPEHVGKRTAQARTVATWLEARPDPASAIIVGTFHAKHSEPELAPLREAGVLFATSELPPDAETFRVPGKRVGVVSHMALWGEAAARYVPGSVRVRDLEVLLPGLSEAEIAQTLSDHNPVSVVLRTEAPESGA